MVAFFFFNDTATTEIYTLSLHDALPICLGGGWSAGFARLARWLSDSPAALAGLADRKGRIAAGFEADLMVWGDRKSTSLNFSHDQILYAVFFLIKKNNEVHAMRQNSSIS